MSIAYQTRVNQRSIGNEVLISGESHVIGIIGVVTVVANFIKLIEVPLEEIPSSVAISGFSEVTTAPGTNEFFVDYKSGRIQFNPSRNGEFVAVTYEGRGSIVDANDVNELQNPVGVALNIDGEITTGHVKPISISTNPIHDFAFPNDVLINGKLTIIGSATEIHTEIVTVFDNIIELNSNASGPATEDSGFEVNRGADPNVNFLWNETLNGWQLKSPAGTSILTALDTDRVGIKTDTPAANLHINGSTLFGVDAQTDPGSITVSQVDDFSGIIITTTGPVVVTMPTPTTTTAGRFFTIVHNDTSSGSLTLDGKSINVGQGTTLMWDGSTWTPVGGGAGGFSLVAGDPGSPSQGDTWFDTITNQFKGYNGTSNVVLG